MKTRTIVLEWGEYFQLSSFYPNIRRPVLKIPVIDGGALEIQILQNLLNFPETGTVYQLMVKCAMIYHHSHLFTNSF